MNNSYISVNGTSFYKDGYPILFHGMGIGSWLNLEHFMIGIPTPDNQIRSAVRKQFGDEVANSFFDSFIRNYITGKDFAFLKSCGINVVRVPFNYRLFIDDENPYEYKPDGFRYFDYLMDLCEKYQIYLLPDLHAVPGGQNPDWHSDNNTGIPQFWHYKVFRDQISLLWGSIAKRYKNMEYLLGYDVLNEPYLIDAPDVLSEFYQDVTSEIRKVDPNHIIFLEGDHFAMQFDCIHDINDANTALTFHYYPTVWEPDLFSPSYDRNIRKIKFKEILNEISTIRERFNRPIFCGEAGYDIDKTCPSHSFELLEDTLDLLNQNNISWTLWCYKDAQYMGMVYPKSTSGWIKFTNKIHASWNHYHEMEQANTIIEQIKEIPEFKNATDDLCYLMQFRQRGILYRFQSECILAPVLAEYTPEEFLKLPESFLFENCDYYQEYYDLLSQKA